MQQKENNVDVNRVINNLVEEAALSVKDRAMLLAKVQEQEEIIAKQEELIAAYEEKEKVEEQQKDKEEQKNAKK